MGTWGTGNFDNDGASDLLYEFVNPFIVTITDLMDSLRDADEFIAHGEEQIMPMLDILITLCNHYNAVPSIESGVLLEWKIKYLRAYDKYIDNFSPDDDFVGARRAVIHKTFESLTAIIDQ